MKSITLWVVTYWRWQRRRVIMLEGNPITKRKLETEGVEVRTYNGSEISLKGAGGPTCLTRPLLRLTS